MRYKKTFVVHFYLDTDAPDQTCGDVLSLPEQQAQNFQNLESLINLLQPQKVSEGRALGRKIAEVPTDFPGAPDASG